MDNGLGHRRLIDSHVSYFSGGVGSDAESATEHGIRISFRSYPEIGCIDGAPWHGHRRYQRDSRGYLCGWCKSADCGKQLHRLFQIVY